MGAMDLISAALYVSGGRGWAQIINQFRFTHHFPQDTPSCQPFRNPLTGDWLIEDEHIEKSNRKKGGFPIRGHFGNATRIRVGLTRKIIWRNMLLDSRTTSDAMIVGFLEWDTQRATK